jgi:YggT family protein
MNIPGQLYWFLNQAVIAVIVTVVVLILLRVIANRADLNPFAWSARTIRRITDPPLLPVRRALVGFGVDPKYAPLVTILITILLGWVLLQLVAGITQTLAGVVDSLARHNVARLIGHVLYGMLGLYSLLIFIRIIFFWVMLSYSNRLMRLLVRVTEPLLAPLRRLVPPVAHFDISPIVAFMILWLLQAAVAGTLLSGPAIAVLR